MSLVGHNYNALGLMSIYQRVEHRKIKNNKVENKGENDGYVLLDLGGPSQDLFHAPWSGCINLTWL